MNARVITISIVLNPDMHNELCAVSKEQLEYWLWKAYVDLNTEASSPDVGVLHPDAVSIVEVDTNPYHH